MIRYLLCAAGAAAVGLLFFFPHCNGGFKLLWVCLCVGTYRGVLESVVADRIGMAAWLLSSGVAMCVDTCRFATWCRVTHCNGGMNVARALFWGGGRSTKLCIFLCKMAAGGDERYLLCAAGAAGVGLPFFLQHCNGGFKLLWVCLCVRTYKGVLESVVADRIGMAAWLLSSGVAMCVDTCGLATWCFKTQCNGGMNVAWALFWGGSRSTKLCIFPCKLAAGGDDKVPPVCGGCGCGRFAFFFFCRIETVASSCFGCACACVLIGVFWNLWLQIALEWLHDCCHLVLICA